MTTSQQKQDILKAICDTIIEAVLAMGPNGLPGGTIYAQLMPFGIDFEQYERIMATLVRIGKITKRGEFYYGI